jgi:hypothetical protein
LNDREKTAVTTDSLSFAAVATLLIPKQNKAAVIKRSGDVFIS